MTRVHATLVITHVAAVMLGASITVALVRSGVSQAERAGSAEVNPVEAPPHAFEWTELPAARFPIPPYAQYLKDVRIMLDPGHGGRADRENWKRGPTGLREAQVNLAVAHFLRGFLQAAGAEVRMTRETDAFLDPDIRRDNSRRIELANDWPADLFLSLHHNGAESPTANYTSIFYHGAPDERPASRCAARYVLAGLNDALRLEQHLPCAVLSDQALFDEGLLVLREARVPAVLVEASFHSNPDQEARLRDAAYNRREAYGLFLGLAQWAQAGLPRVTLVVPDAGRVAPGETITLKLDDGLRRRGGWGSDLPQIPLSTLTVRLDGAPVPYTADLADNTLIVRLPRRLRGDGVTLFVDFQNTFGQHVLHPRLTLAVRR